MKSFRLFVFLIFFPLTITAQEEARMTATFSMAYYWTGEATLGNVKDVLASRIEHRPGDRIVQVDFDSNQSSIEDLAQTLAQKKSLYAVFVETPEERQRLSRPLKDIEVLARSGTSHFIPPKHSLRSRNTEFLELGLTEVQTIVLNAWSYLRGPMPDVLTKEQKRRLGRNP